MTVQEWLGEDNNLGIDIWKRKYRYKNETFDEWLDRVSGGNKDVRELIRDKKFLFGGRILSNRGLDKEGKKISLSNCFPKGTKVYTQNGYKSIENIKKGDMVLTHNKRFCKVNETMNRRHQGQLNIIDGYNFEQIICTENHKFLTNTGWKEAKDLTKNDYIKFMSFKQGDFIPYLIDISKYVHINENEVIEECDQKIRIGTKFIGGNGARSIKYGSYINRFIKINDELLYVFGRWLGDGSITARKNKDKNSIFQIVFNKKEETIADYCKYVIEKYFGIEIHKSENIKQNTIIIKCDSVLLCEFFCCEFGKYGDKKCIRSNQLNNIKNNINWVIGLIDADGLVTDNALIRLCLKNKHLLEQVKECLSLNNIPSSSIKYITNNKSFHIYKLEIPKCASVKILPLLHKTYDDGRMNISESNDNKHLYINNDLYLRIKSNTSIDTKKIDSTPEVYNLSVDDDNTYIVNDVVVHNCYVMSPPDDSIESIFECASKLARTYSYGGGCGVDISKLAPRGAKVNNAAKETSGAVSFMDLYSLVTGLIGQNGRRGALMLSISCEHPDLEEFIELKSDLDRCTKANISVRITDKFMVAVKQHEKFKLSFTREETGETITKEIDAYEMFHKLCEMNWDYAEPGMLFWDRIENWNLLSCDEDFQYAGVNPCAEEPLSAGSSCLLGSINLSEFVTENGTFNFEDFQNTVDIAVKALNDVLDEGLPLHPLQEQRDSVRDWRQIGLGIFGLADMLIKMNIKYGSKQSIDICNMIGYKMAYQAIETSSRIAKNTKAYPKYNKNAVCQSAFWSKHTSLDNRDRIFYNGLANSQLLTIAPTGTLSTMLGVSGGIEPIYANYYERCWGQKPL